MHLHIFQDLISHNFYRGVAPNPSYFLCLETKKVTKENSRLQIILGLLFFSLPTQYNSSSCVLLRQYCLLLALAASLKTVAYSQNSLRPNQNQPTIKMLLKNINYCARANRKWCGTIKLKVTRVRGNAPINIMTLCDLCKIFATFTVNRFRFL